MSVTPKKAASDELLPPALKRQKTIRPKAASPPLPPTLKKLAPGFALASTLLNHPPEVMSYKIGHERFLYVVKLADASVKVYLGAVLESPGISTSPRNIELTISQYKALCGSLVSGKAMAQINRNKDLDRLSPM